MIIRPEPVTYQSLPKDAERQAEDVLRDQEWHVSLIDYWIEGTSPKLMALISGTLGWFLIWLLSLSIPGVRVATTAFTFLIWPFVLVGVGFYGVSYERRHKSRLRTFTVAGNVLTCWTSRSDASGKLLRSKKQRKDDPKPKYWEMWRLPLDAVQRIEIGDAGPYISGNRRRAGVDDVFTIHAGRRYVFGRFDNMVADAPQRFQHEVMQFIEFVRSQDSTERGQALSPKTAATVVPVVGSDTPRRKGQIT